jgi:hypothetical protein
VRVGRRAFLRTLSLGVPALTTRVRAQSGSSPGGFGFPIPERAIRGDSSVMAALRAGQSRDVVRPPHETGLPPVDLAAAGETLRSRFRDLRRHFIFEYYAWYRTDPWYHWDEGGRRPPIDLASNYVPRLGAYDSRDRKVIEQHARWIAETGAGAINYSWWGPDSYEDHNVPLVMDVMRDHDLRVTFHLEPYRTDHAAMYPQDIRYLIRNYGDRRAWDCLLQLENADRRTGPVFKSYRTILPEFMTDCHGVTARVPDYTPDAAWRALLDQVREDLRHDFDHVTLLADSLAIERTAAAGFDGIALYDNLVSPSIWLPHAVRCREQDLLFSFNTNPGYDSVALREVDPDSCYQPLPFVPPLDDLDWSLPLDRRLAARASAVRIRESFSTTIALQTDATLPNARRGFFLVYLNSFNEWFEGHQFEPMKDDEALSPAERVIGYHNAANGDYRRQTLISLLRQLGI